MKNMWIELACFIFTVCENSVLLQGLLILEVGETWKGPYIFTFSLEIKETSYAYWDIWLN